MSVKFKGIVWLGIRTNRFNKLSNFYKNILKLPLIHKEIGFEAFDLPNGNRIEIFSTNYNSNKHFETSPVVGFSFDNIVKTRNQIERKGIKFIGPIRGNKTKWSHFKGPDGNIYEITNRKYSA